MTSREVKKFERPFTFDVSPMLHMAILDSIKPGSLVIRHLDLNSEKRSMKASVDLISTGTSPVRLTGLKLELTGALVVQEVNGRMTLFLAGEPLLSLSNEEKEKALAEGLDRLTLEVLKEGPKPMPWFDAIVKKAVQREERREQYAAWKKGLSDDTSMTPEIYFIVDNFEKRSVFTLATQVEPDTLVAMENILSGLVAKILRKYTLGRGNWQLRRAEKQHIHEPAWLVLDVRMDYEKLLELEKELSENQLITGVFFVDDDEVFAEITK